MIIVRMQGGLGNQMFQHAAGAALAQLHGCELCWDLSAYESAHAHRHFELQHVFGLEVPKASKSVLRSVLGWRGSAVPMTLFHRRHFLFARPESYVVEPHFQFWPDFWTLDREIYLDGYWQSERYFKLFMSSIRTAFAFSNPLTDRNQYLAELMRSCNSVSVHVRRGDYVGSHTARQVHGVCSLDYYKRATQEIMSRVSDPHFFVFSDDPLWTQANLELPGPTTYVDHNLGTYSFCDMHLMSLCNSHIIANSSFSWWGAWLAAATNGLVIAPSQWFSDPRLKTGDLYCPEWIQL